MSSLSNDLTSSMVSWYQHLRPIVIETLGSAQMLSWWKIWTSGQAHIYTLDDFYMPPYCTLKNSLQKDNYLSSCRNILTTKMKRKFEQDGVIAIRGLLSKDLLDGLKASSRLLILEQMKRDLKRSVGGLGATAGIGSNGKQFYATKMGPSFLFSNFTSNEKVVLDKMSGFRNVALSSILPQISAELMGMDQHMGDSSLENVDDAYCDGNSKNESIRILRDVFLAKDDEPYICGWHVDDQGYWPATHDSTGINSWIAIDDMPLAHGGGFALSVGSHTASWGEEARNHIGLREGEVYESAEDMFAKRGEAGTCNLKLVAPELDREIEKRKIIYDIKAGDVIFSTRWLFHRTVAFERDAVRENNKIVQTMIRERQRMKQNCREDVGNGDCESDIDSDDWVQLLDGDVKPYLYRRYSVRYVPGSATLPRGYGTELSILSNSENQGQTLDSVEIKDGPWYPKCWPFQPSNKDMKEIQELAETKLPIAEERRKEVMKEIAPHLQKIARNKRNQMNPNKR